MAIKQMKTGPGVLTIGETGSLVSFQSQVTECILKSSVKRDDPVTVLSGESIPGDREESFTLEGELLQDFGQAGVGGTSVSEWTFNNRGQTFPFDFTPANSGDKKITGDLTVEATDIGGPVGKRATSKFEFACVGEPAITAMA